MERIKIERRLKTVEAEIEAAAGRVSKRPGLLARRLKDVALNRPSVLQAAIEADETRKAVSHVNAKLGQPERIRMRTQTEAAVRTLLASVVEYSWANEARQAL